MRPCCLFTSILIKAYEESLKKVAIVDTKQLLIEIAEEMEQYFSKKIDSLRVSMVLYFLTSLEFMLNILFLLITKESLI